MPVGNAPSPSGPASGLRCGSGRCSSPRFGPRRSCEARRRVCSSRRESGRRALPGFAPARAPTEPARARPRRNHRSHNGRAGRSNWTSWAAAWRGAALAPLAAEEPLTELRRPRGVAGRGPWDSQSGRRCRGYFRGSRRQRNHTGPARHLGSERGAPVDACTPVPAASCLVRRPLLQARFDGLEVEVLRRRTGRETRGCRPKDADCRLLLGERLDDDSHFVARLHVSP